MITEIEGQKRETERGKWERRVDQEGDDLFDSG